MNAQTIRQFAADPAAFEAALIIPSGRGARRFGDIMADFQRERFASLNPALLAVARGEKPITGRHWWEATKGGSKDSDLAIAMLWLLSFSSQPITAEVGAANADQAAEIRKASEAVLRLNPWLAKRIAVQNWKIICEATGSVCEIVSADAAGAHGSRPTVVLVNELSHIGNQEFAETMLDNASKVPHGLVVIATNAGFIDTWQYRWRQIAQDSGRWAFHALSRPSPWLDVDEIAEARRRNSLTRFNRLFRGIWASRSGDAIDAADLDAAFDPEHGPMLGYESDVAFVAGLDLATKRNHAAFCVLGCLLTTKRVYLAHLESWAPGPSGVDLTEVRRSIATSAERFNFWMNGCHYDPWQAELMAQDLRNAGIAMVPTPYVGKNLDLMASTLLQSFRDRTITLYDAPGLRRDLERLCIVEKKFGYKLEASQDGASGAHADRAFALANALPHAMEGSATYYSRHYAPPDVVHVIRTW